MSDTTNPDMMRAEAEAFIDKHDHNEPVSLHHIRAAVLDKEGQERMSELTPEARWYVLNHCVDRILDEMAEACIDDRPKYDGAAEGALLWRGKDSSEVAKRGRELVESLMEDIRDER